jgi:hypothetical protein
MGITTGGFVATVTNFGGLPTVFALSGVLRLFALLPLVFVREQRSVPVGQLLQVLLATLKRQAVAIQAGDTSFKLFLETEKDCPPASSSAQSQ